MADYKVLVINLLIGVFLLSFVNGFFICLHGIKYMDRYFSKLPHYTQESMSPFDCFERMHKYSFSFVFNRSRPPVSQFMKLWLLSTCLSLTFYWLVMLIGGVDYYFGIFD